MDPDELWNQIRMRALEISIGEHSDDLESQAMYFAEDINNLMDWMNKGGFPPKAFTQS